jgi:hypothetical protein
VVLASESRVPPGLNWKVAFLSHREIGVMSNAVSVIFLLVIVITLPSLSGSSLYGLMFLFKIPMNCARSAMRDDMALKL